MVVVVLAFASGMAQAEDGKRKIIIDQDALGPAGSNLKSIVMLLNAPDVDVLGITVSSGDGWRDENVASVLRLLEVIGRTDIGVYPGTVFPLVNTEARSRRWQTLHGSLVYQGAWSRNIPGKHPDTPFEVPVLPQGRPSIKASGIHASEFMVRMVKRYPGEVTIWSGGPMTNLALAARLDENFARTAKELVFMGGSFLPQPADNAFAEEYRLNPRLEFNMRFDPEAASLVLHEPWRKITQIPVDPSTKTLWTKADIAEVARRGSPLGKYIGSYDQSLPMWDEIAAAVWLRPQIVQAQMSVLVDVDTSYTAGYGSTLSWKIGSGPGLGEQPVSVITAIDVPALVRMVKNALSDRR